MKTETRKYLNSVLIPGYAVLIGGTISYVAARANGTFNTAVVKIPHLSWEWAGIMLMFAGVFSTAVITIYTLLRRK